jgi:hypothetical protein
VACRGVEVNGAGPGSGAVRASLEHHQGSSPPQPHDPFAVDKERAVAALEGAWSALYDITACEGGFEAVRKRRPRIALTAETPDGLARAMLNDSGLSSC